MGKYLDVGKKGVHFQDVERKIYRYYRKKGYSEAKARRIARATAGKIFWRKFGKKKGSKIIAKARTKAAKAKKKRRKKKKRRRR